MLFCKAFFVHVVYRKPEKCSGLSPSASAFRRSMLLPSRAFPLLTSHQPSANSLSSSCTVVILSILPTFAPQNINPFSTSPFTASISTFVMQ